MAHTVDLLAGVDIKEPIHSGILYKQAHNNRYSVFNKRFFVLYPKLLLYYVHERDYHKDVAKGHLEVSVVSCIELVACSVARKY